MNIGIALEKNALYFLWFEEKKIIKKKIQTNYQDYLKVMIAFLKKSFSKEYFRNLSVQIVANKTIFPNWNNLNRQEIKKELLNINLENCFFPETILCLKLSLPVSYFQYTKSTFLIDLLDFNALFLLKENIIIKCSFAKWNLGKNKEGEPQYFGEYFLDKNLNQKQKYHTLITNIVNLYDPHQIIFLTAHKIKNYSSLFDKKIPFFKNNLQTKIKFIPQNLFQLAFGAALKK